MSRPEGHPGTARFGTEYPDMFGDIIRTGLTYPAVMDESGVVRLWLDGRWVRSPGYGAFFTAGQEWEADCTHEGLVPWKGCDTEADCRSLRREDAARDRADR